MAAKGTKGFFIWLRANMPRVYEDVKREFKDSSQLSGMRFGLAADPVSVSTEAPPTSTLVQTIKEIANIGAQAYLTREQAQAQQRILETQLNLAQRGLPLMSIDPAQYGLQPSVGVGLTADTKQLLTYGAIGLGAVYLFSQLASRR